MGTFDPVLHASSYLALSPFQTMEQSVPKASEVMDNPKTPFQVNCMVEWWASVKLQLTSGHAIASELTQAGCWQTTSFHWCISLDSSIHSAHGAEDTLSTQSGTMQSC